MKSFRKLCAALVLSAVLILPAFAGETQFPGMTASDSQSTELCAAGETQFPGMTSDCKPQAGDEDTLDPTTETILILLEGLLSIF